ncbi:hypothetical protein PV326_008289 [Microctonus aethiopoides]|nr:hypothetical protein PV326_008289 [Microctonus aethiopoides]
MSINCFKCNQLLVRERRQCSTCLRQFHPSFSRAYLSTRTANICCLKHLSAIMPQDAQLTSKQLLSTKQLKSSSSRSLSSSDTSLTTLSNVSPALPLSSLEVNLNAFIAQQTQFNNHLSDVLSKQAASLNEQTNKLNDQNNKLNDIKSIAKSVAEHQVKIKKLEQQNDLLSKQVVDLVAQNKSLSNDVNQLKSSAFKFSNTSLELIISGVPSQLTDEPLVIVDKVLNSLQCSQLLSDVLNVRRLPLKLDARSSPHKNQKSNSSLIVKFKSHLIAMHVIENKRRKGPLTLVDVFDTNIRGNVYAK